MTLHLIKLCVGCDSVDDLRQWQREILAKKRKKGEKPVLIHWTRMTPKRRDDVLDGGSLYWVIKGYVRVRHRILDLKQGSRDGVPHCGIVYDPRQVQTQLMSHRPFQGWRYFEADDAPPDLGARGLSEALPRWDKEPPPKLLQELKDLGLL